MISREEMLKKYVEALRCGRAAAFLGAGVSKPVGFFDWRELLRGPAGELGLDVDKEHDLIGLAQMYVLKKGNRGGLTREILNHFGRDVAGTEIHRTLAGLPVSRVWTTNYDLVIEETLRDEGVDCYVVRDDATLAYSNANAPVTVYKMHGDVSQLNDIVLTREDYECYDARRSAMASAFYCALVEYTFIFLGFSFNDPNLQKVLGKIRTNFKENTREHFTIMRRPQPGDQDYRYEKNKFELFVEDLKRYNIQTVAVDSYSEIANIIKQLRDRYYQKNIYITGNQPAYGVFASRRFENFCYLLGNYIIAEGYNLTSGLGREAGMSVFGGAVDELYRSGSQSQFFARFKIFPTTATEQQGLLGQEENKIRHSGCCIFVGDCGAGYETAREYGRLILPVGATGGGARVLWEMEKNHYCGNGDKIAAAYKVLGEENKDNMQLIKAILILLNKLLT